MAGDRLEFPAEWAATNTAAAVSTLARARPLRLLVVDDDESVGALVRRVARGCGFDVRLAEDGNRAAEHLATKPCDVLVTDVHMPETDGLELIQIARALQPAVAIVAMSGGNSYGHNFLRTAQLLGATRVLHKPFAIDELIAVLRHTAVTRAVL